MKTLDISTPKFPNTFTMVDDDDYDFLSQWKWCPVQQKISPYARRAVVNPKGVTPKLTVYSMHRVIMCAPKGMFVDHINGNTLDNRRANLRTCTQQENTRNQRKQAGKSSVYKGVHLETRLGRYRAQIRVNGKRKFLGYFISEIDAALAYDRAAIEFFGEFANPNFKQKAQP